MCDGTGAERGDDERPCTFPRHAAVAVACAARRRSRAPPRSGGELPPDFGEAFLILPGQHTSAGVGRTFALRAAGCVHDRNAKAARPPAGRTDGSADREPRGRPGTPRTLRTPFATSEKSDASSPADANQGRQRSR